MQQKIHRNKQNTKEPQKLKVNARKIDYIDPRNDITIYREETTQALEFRRLTPIEKKKIQKRSAEDINIGQTHTGFLQNEQIVQLDNSIGVIKQPEGLITRLMDYQLYGVGWMISREKSHTKGGILADQMGMGKTLQTIGLMLSGDVYEKNLIVVPTIALNQWIEELDKHSPGMFNIYRHHGRCKIGDNFINHNVNSRRDIIITTYGTIESDYRRKNLNIYDLSFDRVILDEAHCIKDSRSNTNTAILHINSKYRWGLTGTPVQNRVSDLFSLVKFLRLDPFSY